MSTTQQDLSIDQQQIQELLMGPWAEDRRAIRALMEDPVFHYQFNLTKEEQRELTLNQLKELAERKVIAKAYPKAFGGREDPGANVGGFAEMFHASPLMQVKGGVQWGLFGSAI